jgi:hypothetical protein
LRLSRPRPFANVPEHKYALESIPDPAPRQRIVIAVHVPGDEAHPPPEPISGPRRHSGLLIPKRFASAIV